MNYQISLVSFLVCLVVGHLFSKSRAFSFLNKRESRFETLDGLRGFLAISVLFHHFVITYYWKLNGGWGSPSEILYKNYGKVGVGIFFMITGFLFTSKLIHNKWNLDWLRFFESRVFRIVPIYVFAVLCIVGIVFVNTEYQLLSSKSELLGQLSAWILFHGNEINSFKDTRLIIAGVDWTLKYEWLFYLALPFVAALFRKGNKVLIAFFMLLIIALNLKSFDVFSFNTGYAILFLLGGVTAYISTMKETLIGYEISSKRASLVTSVLIVAVLFYPRTLDVLHIALMFVFFLLIVLGNDMFGLLKLQSAKVLGEVSYSIYLLHGLVLYLLFTQFEVLDITLFGIDQYSLLMPLVAILVVLLSIFTFLYIEKPFIDFGRRYAFSNFVRSLNVRK